MKDREVHNGLPQKEVRDFLAMSLVKAFEEESDNKKEHRPYDGKNAVGWAIKDTESQIAYLQKALEIKRGVSAVLFLIKKNNWEEFDVSDQTERDGQSRLSMSFIGNKSEHRKLLQKISNQTK